MWEGGGGGGGVKSNDLRTDNCENLEPASHNMDSYIEM